MIAYLKGQILKKTLKSIIVLSGDVGYEVFLTPKHLEQAKQEEEVKLFVHSHIKEDAFDLYGFKSVEELDFFRKVISVSGVGPKSALSVLALAEVSDLKRAISGGDASFLQKVSGIGKKTAERLVLELKEKFINDISGSTSVSSGDEQLAQALVSLGYRDSEARDIIQQMPTAEGDLSTRLKEALKFVPK